MIDWKQIACNAFRANEAERKDIDVERDRLKRLQALAIQANSELERLIRRAIPFKTRIFEPVHHDGVSFGVLNMVRIEVAVSPQEIMYFSGGDSRMIEAVAEIVAREIIREGAKRGILRDRA